MERGAVGGGREHPPYALRKDPRPAGAKRLRIRVGDWRILYEVREQDVVALVVRIGRPRVGGAVWP